MCCAVFSVLTILATLTPLFKRQTRRFNHLHSWLALSLQVAGAVGLVLSVISFASGMPLYSAVAALSLLLGLAIALWVSATGRINPQVSTAPSDVLFVAAHPDDLEIACGATMAKLVDLGHRVHALVLADGRDGGDAQIREKEAGDSGAFIGFETFEHLKYPDRELDSRMKDVIAAVEKAIQDVQPDVVFTHSSHDVHQDHFAVHNAVMRAGRSHNSILCFESPSVTADFKPTVFIDVDDYQTVKRAAIETHASQVMKPYMRPPVTESTLRFRGRQGRLPRAEGFEVMRLRLTQPVQFDDWSSSSEVSG